MAADSEDVETGVMEFDNGSAPTGAGEMEFDFGTMPDGGDKVAIGPFDFRTVPIGSETSSPTSQQTVDMTESADGPHHDDAPVTKALSQTQIPTPGPAIIEASGEFLPDQVVFGRYIVKEKIGRGGMGTVWHVTHRELNTDRALKLIVAGIAYDSQARARFRREAQVMAQFLHPHAVIIHDARLTENDVAYIDMEFIQGRALDKEIHRGSPMPLEWIARVLDQLCDVLQLAHEKGIVHRDLKPANLMLLADRPYGREHLKVLDFGIAKILGEVETEAGPHTMTGMFMGTPPYASPEQSDGKADTRSDIYAVGVILYEFLTGHRPFTGPPARILVDTIMTPPPPFSKTNPEVRYPPEIEALVISCMAKNPDDRPSTARAVADAFLAALPQEERVKLVKVEIDDIDDIETHRPAPLFATYVVLAILLLTAVILWSGILLWRNSEVSGHVMADRKAGEVKSTDRASFAGKEAGESMTLKVGKVEFNLRWCPTGTFTMGSPLGEQGHRNDEGPVEVVITQGYWMMQTEMDQELYKALMKDNPSEFKGDRLPVESIDFDQAVACAKALTTKLHTSHNLPDDWVFQLPTEAQWEYSARAGSKTAYPWGNVFNSNLANFDEKKLNKTTRVGSYQPNAWGLRDTVGNVLEWTSDAYTPTLSGQPGAGKKTSERVLRGGNWDSPSAQHCRSASRRRDLPSIKGNNRGFRLVTVYTEAKNRASDLSKSANKQADSIPMPSAEAGTAEVKSTDRASFAGKEAGESMTLKVGKVEFNLRWCPTGTFTMGSPLGEPHRKSDEGPIDVVITKGFWIMQTEVTQKLFTELGSENDSHFKGDELPVENVNYQQTVAFAEALTKKFHTSGDLPDDWEFQLPTEAQWEYSARAGSKKATPFGDSLNSKQANFDGNHPYSRGAAREEIGPVRYKTSQVGSYKPNAWGLFDTVGNVCEWTSDAYKASLSGGFSPFEKGDHASHRVFRGGAWDFEGFKCRSANRDKKESTDRSNNRGFRLAAIQAEPMAK